jgi:transcription antitermination factor NusG
LTSDEKILLTDAESVGQRISPAKGDSPDTRRLSCYSISRPRWYVVKCLPRKEKSACRSLIESGFDETFFPTQVVWRREYVAGKQNGHKTKVIVPMFSGHIFVKFDVQVDQWADIRRDLYGVDKLLLTASRKPWAMPAGEVERLIDETPQRLQLEDPETEPLPKGKLVRIERGILEARLGEVKSCDGVTTQVELAMFGGLCTVTIRREDLLPVE